MENNFLFYWFGNESHPDLEVYYVEDEESEVITEFVSSVPLEEREVILNHDILGYKELVTAIADTLAESVRDVTFGPFSCKTKVIKLKENWKELCHSYEEGDRKSVV